VALRSRAEDGSGGDHGACGFADLPTSLSVITWLLAACLEFLVTASPKFPPGRLADAFDQVVEPLITEIT